MGKLNGKSESKVKIINTSSMVPKITVLVAVYNAEKYLRDCLDSLVGQTLKEIQVLCVDDASTDHSWSILQE